MQSSTHYRCEAGHREYHPLCTCCFQIEEQREKDMRHNDEYFIVRPTPPDGDGLSRIIIDTYSHFCMANEFVEMLNKHTGLKWQHLGTFMDNSCFATSEALNAEFKVPYPRRAK